MIMYGQAGNVVVMTYARAGNSCTTRTTYPCSTFIDLPSFNTISLPIIMPTATDATASTVSPPLTLGNLRSKYIGEISEQEQSNGDQPNGAKSRKIKPDLRATLTSLTTNNVRSKQHRLCSTLRRSVASADNLTPIVPPRLLQLGTLKRLINVVC